MTLVMVLQSTAAFVCQRTWSHPVKMAIELQQLRIMSIMLAVPHEMNPIRAASQMALPTLHDWLLIHQYLEGIPINRAVTMSAIG